MSDIQKDFSCIGGLEKHIRIVKEMVLFPLMYGEVYAKFNLRPPRGLLFYGPPGTGKTLVASALAVECSNAERKVSFISRKGSDCLSKWVGESERKLQNIFQLAQQNKPCIIFFDEVDGLAPIRSIHQDFVHASVVSTLLALMDGLDCNSEIIVIGATNRLDAIDPALRRPGRFDRELYFPLPCYSARKEILSIYVKSWKQKPAEKFLAYVAAKTVGYCGSDLQALCTEAVMCCVRRNYPQIYTSKSKHSINARSIKVDKEDFLKAQKNIVPAAHRVTIAPVKCLSTKIRPLLENNLNTIMSNLQQLCPAGMLTSDGILGQPVSKSANCPRMLLCGSDDCHTRHLGPAILHTLEHLPCHIIDVTTLFEETSRAAEEAIIQIVKGAKRTLPSILYVPDILSWWDLVDETARVVFTSLMRGLDYSVNMLILTTAHSNYAYLPQEISALFDEHQGEVFEIGMLTDVERESYFRQLFKKVNVTAYDSISSGSANIDIMYLAEWKKGNSDSLGKKQKFDLLLTKKRKRRGRRKRKFGNIRSNLSITTSKTRVNIKRECSASGEGRVTKRQRLSDEVLSTRLSTDTISDSELQNLLNKSVQLTQNWPSCHIESLFASLERTLENNNENTYSSFQKCIAHFEQVENMKICIKKEKI